MNYQETLDFLFNALPMYQRIGAAAFRKDLANTISLCAHLDHPQSKFKSIHVAGTNGKGSTSHAIASVLQEAGYKVGLYTSPHLKSFTERIKINGMEISEPEVVKFVQLHKPFLERLKPSFFEMTVGMAFDHFARQQVDIAVIEVGMGGRLDSTNVIHPVMSVITSIGMDHTQFLGDTLEKIALEKAGIIKNSVPVVISQTQANISAVFRQVAKEKQSSLYFGDETFKVIQSDPDDEAGLQTFKIQKNGETLVYKMDLLGKYQAHNLPGILMGIETLNELGYAITDQQVKLGLQHIVRNTGLKGRWQQLGTLPKIICDTGHNAEGIQIILEQLTEILHDQLIMVLGVVEDKDLNAFLALLPKSAYYVFCQARIPRALPVEKLYEAAMQFGLKGEMKEDVNEAIDRAKKLAKPGDLIFVGGSTFVVAEIMDL